MRKRISKVVAVVVLGIGLTLIQGATAYADAGAKASCLGIEASSISPHGSSDEFSGGMPELNRLIRSFGLHPGEFYGGWAKLHLESHEGCDAATE